MEGTREPGAGAEGPPGVGDVERSEGCRGNWRGPTRGGAEGFDFLGFHHRMVKSWKKSGRYWLHKWPSDRAMGSIRAKVRVLTSPSRVGADLGVVVEDLNPVLRGWGAYFRQGNSSAKFGAVDTYVHERMARLASRKHGLRGINWLDRFTWDWLGDLGIYRLTGTVRYPNAHALR